MDTPEPPPRQPIEEQREDARQTYTIVLLLVFVFQLAIGAIALFFGRHVFANAEEYLRVTLPATLGLLGSAMGFYFGSRR